MKPENIDTCQLVGTVLACRQSELAGSLVSTAQAVEELRIMSGDFTTSDEELANAITEVALGMGCAVILDEQPGANVFSAVVI